MGTERLPEIEVISEHTDHPASEGTGGLAALMVVVGLVIAGTVLAQMGFAYLLGVSAVAMLLVRNRARFILRLSKSFN